MGFGLGCGVCGRDGGEYRSAEEREDAARALGWALGENEAVCRGCLAIAEPPSGSAA